MPQNNGNDSPVGPAKQPAAETLAADESLRLESTLIGEADSAATELDTAGGIAATGPAPAELVGSTLDGRYFVEKEIGKGGIGAVYLARDRRLVDRAVVVKVLLEKSLQSEWALRKFKHEKEALALVDHPGIIGVLDDGELPNGMPYLVMQYVEGVPLRSLITSDGMDLELVAGVIKQIGLALDAAHAKGVLHRDLKPENIMVQTVPGDLPHIKVIDFGIAKVRDSKLAPSTAVAGTAGTYGYMSPQQLNAEKLTAASDVYALGIIAYELVTGRRPFNPASPFQLLEMQRDGVQVKPTALRPALPKAAESVILCALSFAPEKRYQSSGAFGVALERALGDQTPFVPAETARATGKTAASPTLPVPRPAVPTIDPLHDAVAARMAQKYSPSAMPYQASAQVPPNAMPPVPAPARSSSKLPLLAIAAMVVIGLIAFGIWYVFRPSNNPVPPGPSPTTTKGPTRNLNYWLTVQKFRDGKPYESEFVSSGQEIFENGWKFRIYANSTQAGYLYLLNQGPGRDSAPTLNLLYPMPAVNGTKAELPKGQSMQTGWYFFDQNQGAEHFWIVFSAQPVAALDSAVTKWVNPEHSGTIGDASEAASILTFLKEKRDAAKPELTKDDDNERSMVKGTGDILATQVDLKHH